MPQQRDVRGAHAWRPAPPYTATPIHKGALTPARRARTHPPHQQALSGVCSCLVSYGGPLCDPLYPACRLSAIPGPDGLPPLGSCAIAVGAPVNCACLRQCLASPGITAPEPTRVGQPYVCFTRPGVAIENQLSSVPSASEPGVRYFRIPKLASSEDEPTPPEEEVGYADMVAAIHGERWNETRYWVAPEQCEGAAAG